MLQNKFILEIKLFQSQNLQLNNNFTINFWI